MESPQLLENARSAAETIELLNQEELIELETRQWLKRHPHFRYKPVDFRTFIEDPQYLDQKKEAYENVKKMGAEITEGGYMEVIIKAGIGTGKSYFVAALICYAAHLLLCFKDPHGYFGLSRDKPITCVNMSINEKQAKRVIFSSVRSFISKSPWFKKFQRTVLKTSIFLDHEAIELMCGNSTENSAIGLNLFMGVIDEAAFFIDNDEKSGADDLWEMIVNRISSRFGQCGMAVAISSSLHDEDFINKKFDESQKHPETMYGLELPTWRGKDRDRMSPEVFIFDSKNLTVLDDDMRYKKKMKDGSISVSKTKYKIGSKVYNLPLDANKKKRLAFSNETLNERFWIIPMDFYHTFKKNPEKAARDIGVKAFRNQDLFIKLPTFVDKAFKSKLNFARTGGKWKIKPNMTDEPLFVHIDMGLNKQTKSGDGDAAGIAVGYFNGYDEKCEGRPRTRIIALEQILRSQVTGEIRFSDVRARVMALVKAGYEIASVTIDGWQSVDTVQTFNSQGIFCEVLSVDRTVDPYEAAKEAMYEGRLEGPDHAVVKKEFKKLIVVKGKKVDHPKKGSKDCSDAIAGVVYGIAQYYGVDPVAEESEDGTISFGS